MVMKAVATTIKEFEHYLNKDNFILERKFDGSRSIYLNGKLVSDKRDGFKEKRYPQISQALNGINAILDGELWVKSDRVVELSRTENWNEAVFMVFDIQKLDDKDLTKLPLKERRKILESLNLQPPIFLTKQYANLKEAWDLAEKENWEGLIAKDLNSPYLEKRSPYWFKLKRYKEAVVTIDKWEQGNTHGTFICNDGILNNIRVGTLSTKYVEEYLKAVKECKRVDLEIQYLNKTTTGHYFQPILKRLIIK